MYRGSVVFVALVIASLTLAPPVAAGGWETYDESMGDSWERIYNAGDVAGTAAFYAEDAIRMPPNAPAVSGREAIGALIKQGMEMGLAKVDLETDEVEVSGDMGFAIGSYKTFDAEGNQTDNGKWMQIGKKIDGKWYAYRDIWNSDNPLP
jgi:ketosteroid isomerase-like protein